MDNITQGRRANLLGLFICLLAAPGCTSTDSFQVTLRNASGLTAEAPVFVAGVQVGEVTSVEIEGNRATVEFDIRSEHEITLHGDACATLQAPTGVIALGVQPGTSGTFEGTIIGECSPMDLVREAMDATMPDLEIDLDGHETGRQAGEFVRDLADGLREGLEEPAPATE